MRPALRLALPALLAWAGLVILVPAGASAGFKTGLLNLTHSDADMARSAQAKADILRLNVSWRAVAGGGPPANPANPADPAYNFGSTDAAVSQARARGLQVLLTITSAPNFAEGANRPGGVSPGAWKPNPGAFGQFAEAVASRYSGSFGGLPRVSHYQAWNEGNLDLHLAPQYVGKKPFMPRHYRKMLNAFYGGVHAGQPNAKVVTTGTAPYGDARGGARTRPLTFWRKVFCLKGCNAKTKLDVMAHHPINTSGGPHRSAVHPADASTPDFKNVRKILREAERRNRVKGGRHPLWATELWWESKPPDRCGVKLKRHARYVKQSFRLLRKQGASAVIWLGIRDQNASANECGRTSLQSGLTRANGKRKPAFRAFRSFGR